jgi:hypothetical protein
MLAGREVSPASCCAKAVGSGSRRGAGLRVSESPSFPAVAAYLRVCVQGQQSVEVSRRRTGGGSSSSHRRHSVARTQPVAPAHMRSVRSRRGAVYCQKTVPARLHCCPHYSILAGRTTPELNSSLDPQRFDSPAEVNGKHCVVVPLLLRRGLVGRPRHDRRRRHSSLGHQPQAATAAQRGARRQLDRLAAAGDAGSMGGRRVCGLQIGKGPSKQFLITTV